MCLLSRRRQSSGGFSDWIAARDHEDLCPVFLFDFYYTTPAKRTHKTGSLAPFYFE
jgi:hypothetical protein